MSAKKTEKKKDSLTCDVQKIYGFLNDEGTKVYASVSWNGKPAQDEIRRCWKDDKGELHLGKGISVTESEIRRLSAVMERRPKPVDFSKVFESSAGIMEARAAGFKTTDGFIELRKKPGK